MSSCQVPQRKDNYQVSKGNKKCPVLDVGRKPPIGGKPNPTVNPINTKGSGLKLESNTGLTRQKAEKRNH